MNPSRPSLASALVLFTLGAAPAIAQSIAAGYARSSSSLPTGSTSVAVVANGVVRFDGTDVLLDEPGHAPRVLLHFAQPRFPAFTLPLDGDQIVFADSSVGELWLLSTAAGATPRLLTTLVLPYDATPLGTGRIAVSAKLGGFAAADNDLVVVDLHTGAHAPLGRVPGASGPLQLDARGDLVYLTASPNFPPPPGTVEVLTWPAARWAQTLAGGPLLDAANATVRHRGLDTASAIAIDDDDDLFAVDWFNNRIVEINDLHGGRPWTTVLGDWSTAAVSPVDVQFTAGAGGVFEPFAHGRGGALFVVESDFATTDRLLAMAAHPAPLVTAAGPIPQGPFAVVLDAAVRTGPALLAIGAIATGIAVPIALPGFEQPLPWDAGMLQPIAVAFATTDVLGAATFPLRNPGTSGGVVTVFAQAAFVDATLPVLGATQVLPLPLGR